MGRGLTTKRTKQLKLLENFLSQLPRLKKSREITHISDRQATIPLLLGINSLLHPIYERQLKELKGRLDKGIRSDPRLYAPTTFEVMKRHTLEESHSNVIAYLLKNKKNGPRFLNSILHQLSDTSRSVLPAIPRNLEIQILREVSVAEHKRVDILVVAPSFYVAIENKFYSRIHKTNQGLTQTEFYHRELVRRYRNRQGFFIVLDYKGEEKSENYERGLSTAGS